MSSLKKLAIKGTIWTFVGYGSSQVLRLLSNLILTRLLVPELFGLMALVNTFIVGLNLFSDIGINPSIVRSERGEDPDFLNTAWTLQVIRGFGLWIGSWLIAFPISQFYDEPKLMWLIPIVGFNTILSGFNSTSLALLNRKIEIGKLTLIEITTQITSLTVMIIWAFFRPTILALVIGTFVSNIVKLSWSHYISPIHHRFRWNKDCLTELINFGRWIFVSTAITFLANQADRLILGKFLPLEILGIYTIAFTFADIPRTIINQISSRIIFPLVSLKRDLPRPQLSQTIYQARKFLLIGAAFLLSILTIFGDVLIDLLYDSRYSEASWMLPILALGLWPSILLLSVNKILYSLGQPQYNAIGSFLKFIYMIVLLPLVLMKGNLYLGMIVIGFNDIPIYIVTCYGLAKNQFSPLKQDIIVTLILLVFLFFLTFLRNNYNLFFSSI